MLREIVPALPILPLDFTAQTWTMGLKRFARAVHTKMRQRKRYADRLPLARSHHSDRSLDRPAPRRTAPNPRPRFLGHRRCMVRWLCAIMRKAPRAHRGVQRGDKVHAVRRVEGDEDHDLGQNPQGRPKLWANF